jgi:hypothetical protein
VLSNPFPFLAKFRHRQRLLAEDVESSGIEVRQSITIPLGRNWQATIDGKWMGCIALSIILYALAALLANEWLYLLSCALTAAAFPASQWIRGYRKTALRKTTRRYP